MARLPQKSDNNLLVGFETSDDAGIYRLSDEVAIVTTADFITPPVDDPYVYGQIGAANSISDVYAMGGEPLMAVAVLGWPLDKLPAEVAARVLEGGRAACARAGIPLAGGHSIDSPEPMFGLAVTGQVSIENLKRNDRAVPGCKLFLTKPLGVGLVATAQKRGLSDQADFKRAVKQMTTLNNLGTLLGSLTGVKAMTDVSGFGLLGHLTEMCEGSGVSASLDSMRVPRLKNIDRYIDDGCTSGGTDRNFESYGQKISALTKRQKALLCDPQTSGGLLVAVAPDGLTAFEEASAGLGLESFGQIIEATEPLITVN